jgi:hypothetical protein
MARAIESEKCDATISRGYLGNQTTGACSNFGNGRCLKDLGRELGLTNVMIYDGQCLADIKDGVAMDPIREASWYRYQTEEKARIKEKTRIESLFDQAASWKGVHPLTSEASEVSKQLNDEIGNLTTIILDCQKRGGLGNLSSSFGEIRVLHSRTKNPRREFRDKYAITRVDPRGNTEVEGSIELVGKKARILSCEIAAKTRGHAGILKIDFKPNSVPVLEGKINPFFVMQEMLRKFQGPQVGRPKLSVITYKDEVPKINAEEVEGAIAVPIDKLRQLDTLFPNRGEYVEEFGRFLAQRFEEASFGPILRKLTPEEYLQEAHCALDDIMRGEDSSGKPINSELVGLHGDEYMLIGICLPGITEAVYPQDFADQVKELAWGPSKEPNIWEVPTYRI